MPKSATTNADNHFVRTVHTHLRHLLGKMNGVGILAVSGGADSVALLRALADGWPYPLHVAHVNHQLRGADADADAEFVQQLCPHLPHHMLTADVAARAAATQSNLEATARTIRYQYFADLAQQLGASWVATAHTLDDQAETILHRLVRGTSLRGLRGIAVQRPLTPAVQLVRPMLQESRASVLSYLHSIQQSWREDASNADQQYTRNRIRHELLPLLRTFNPAIHRVLGQLAEQAHEQFIAVEAHTRQTLQKAEHPRVGAICVLDQSVLKTLTEHEVRELFNCLWEREGWERSSMTYALWQRVADVALGHSSGWDLPHGLRIERRGLVLCVGPKGQHLAHG